VVGAGVQIVFAEDTSLSRRFGADGPAQRREQPVIGYPIEQAQSSSFPSDEGHCVTHREPIAPFFQ
jgi:hypothetical protein